MSDMQIVQVGLGGWGRNWYSQVLSKFPGVSVVGLVDSSSAAIAAAKKELDAPSELYYPTLADAMAATDCEAVVITASLEGHVPTALAAIESGKHVLTEKPFAPSIAEADRTVHAAEQAGAVLMVSQNYRYYPAPRAVCDLVSGLELGELGALHVDFRRDNVEFRERSKRHYALSHPLLADMAIHHFDLMRMVTGSEPRQMSFYTHNPPWSHYNDPPAANGTIEFENGVVASYRGSWVSPGPITPWAGEWRMEFSKGEVRWTSRADETARADEVLVRPLGKPEKQLPMKKLHHLDRAGSLAEFVRAIREGTPYENSGASNRGSIAMVFAAIESSEKLRPVPVSLS